jgi:hypothetical protein
MLKEAVPSRKEINYRHMSCFRNGGEVVWISLDPSFHLILSSFDKSMTLITAELVLFSILKVLHSATIWDPISPSLLIHQLNIFRTGLGSLPNQ